MFWKKATLIIGGPILLLLLLLLGALGELFLALSWYDKMMHLLGGAFFVISLAGMLWHLQYKKSPGRIPCAARFKGGLLVVLLLIAIAWEVFEVIAGVTPNWTHSVSDTFADILCALLGAALVLPFIQTTQPE